MSKFSRDAHTVMSDTPNYAWIALHRSVEANARLTEMLKRKGAHRVPQAGCWGGGFGVRQKC
jgi:hypothetical protein